MASRPVRMGRTHSTHGLNYDLTFSQSKGLMICAGRTFFFAARPAVPYTNTYICVSETAPGPKAPVRLYSHAIMMKRLVRQRS